jgi:hypothetical protein
MPDTDLVHPEVGITPDNPSVRALTERAPEPNITVNDPLTDEHDASAGLALVFGA